MLTKFELVPVSQCHQVGADTSGGIVHVCDVARSCNERESSSKTTIRVKLWLQLKYPGLTDGVILAFCHPSLRVRQSTADDT